MFMYLIESWWVIFFNRAIKMKTKCKECKSEPENAIKKQKMVTAVIKWKGQ